MPSCFRYGDTMTHTTTDAPSGLRAERNARWVAMNNLYLKAVPVDDVPLGDRWGTFSDLDGNIFAIVPVDEIERLHVRAELIGREHGTAAAEWYIGEILYRSSGDTRLAFQNLQRGLDDGDPDVLDDLPYPDLSGEMADGYTPARLAEDLDIDADDYPEDMDDLCLSYEEGFNLACQAEVERIAREATS